jgi:hypothetical protein
MRASAQLEVQGDTYDEIAGKTLRAVAEFLGISIDEIENRVDIEVDITPSYSDMSADGAYKATVHLRMKR